MWWNSHSTYCTAWTAIAVSIIILVSVPVSAEPDVERQQALRHLLKHDCGSCHGMTLKGGLGPALLPENLINKSDEMLKQTILYGRPPTPMPPWRGILSEDEVEWMVMLLRRGKE